MVRKIILSLLIMTSISWAAETSVSKEKNTRPQAVIASTNAASATAWASLSISFVVVLGIIIATAIQKNKS